MRKLKLFFACLLMAVLSIGQMWGGEVTISPSQALNDGGVDPIEISCAKGDGTSNPAISSGQLRLYQAASGKTTGNTITFSSESTITSIVFTFANNMTASNGSFSEGSYDSGTSTWTGSSTSLTLTVTGTTSGTRIYITNMVVTYEAEDVDPYTVSFSTGAGNPAVSPIAEATGGAGITLPAGPTPACSADGWTFAGWAAAAVASETTTAPTLLSGTYHPTENCTLFAVYKRTEAGGGSTTKSMTSFEAISGNVENDVNVSYAAAQGTAGTAPAINNGEIRIYQNGGLLTITANNGSKLNSITIGSSMTTKVTYAVDGGSASGNNDIAKNVTFTVDELDATEVVFTCTGTDKNSRLYLNNLSVTYGGGGTTYYLSAPSCCEKHAITIATGIENGSVEADFAEACEGTAVTLTFTPALNYHLSGWTLNGVAQDVNVNTFSMPAGAATVSATFAQDACDPLATPVVAVSGKAYPYNAVKLAWTAIEHADAYKVYIYYNEDNELEHNDAFAGVEYTIGQTLSASTTYKYSVQAVSNTPATYCPSEAASTFVTDALPTAHLTLMDIEGEHASSGDHAILTPFALPTTAASCSKAFVGWDADADCATAPTYSKGAEFTFQNTTGVTLYAVYADETPGEATLTKMTSADALADGDKVVIVANGTQYGVYQETQSNSYVKYWELAASTPAISELGAKKIWNVTADNTNWKFGDATNGYLYTSGSNNLAVSTDNATSWSVTWNESKNGFILKSTGGRYFACRTDLTGDNANLYRMSGTSIGTNGVYGMDIYKYATSASTFSNYSTTCVAAPTAEPASASIEVAAAGGSSTLGVTYENVNLAGVEVALFNNEACTEAFDGGWLTASIAGDDKHIAYSAQENTTSYVARTAYIKLTAPETNGAADPAVVVIPVTQAKYIPVYANLAALVEANLSSGTDVTVSFANEVITNDHYISQGTKRAGVMLTTEAANDKAIEIFYNKGETVVPAEWVVGGSLSATAKTFTWTFFNDQWELVPLGNDWTWDNGDLTYTAPKTVSSVVVTGAPTKTTYVDGEKFAPAGLTVTVNYSDATSEVNPVGVTFACDPVRVAKSDDPVSVNVVATFNEVSSEAFEVTGLTVGDIQLKTVAEFIAAGNADMRCYLEGTVSDIETGNKLKYGNFNLTDASGTIYVYGCLNQAGEAEHFEDLDVQNGDKIKVIAEDYDYYNSKHEAKNVQFVSKTPAATISIDDIDMETGDELALSSIVATITPAAAQSATITYNVTAGTAVTISEGKIIAEAAGEATITASIAEGVGYLAANTTFMVTVTAPDNRKIATASAFTALSGDMSSTDISFAAYKGDGTNAPVVRSGDNPVTIRLYKPDTNNSKNTGNYLTLTAKVGCTIDQVKIEFSGNADAAYCKDAEALPTSKYITGQEVLLTPTGLDAQSVSIVNLKNGSIDVATITVWYNGDPLAVHHYILGGTYETTFEQNTTFSYEGLTVTAAYDELETITEPINDFTVVADLSEEGPATASVRRNDAEIATYAITVTQGKANPNLAYTPNELEVAAADVASWVAPEFSNPFEVSPITYSSNKTAVAKVTSDGVITLQGGYGTAVITASFAGNNDYIASQATYTITVNEPVDDIKGHWVVANAVEAGMEIIITSEAEANNVKSMGAQASSNRQGVASTINTSGVLSPATGTKIFTLVDAGDDLFAIKATNGNYLYASSNSSNQLKETSSYESNNNAKWSISINEGIATIQAQGSNGRNTMRYNPNNGSPLFACYAPENNMQDIVIYAISEEVKDGEVIDASSLREDEDIVINGNASMTINDEVSLGDIYVKDGQTLTIEASEDATLGNLDLENGAILDLDVTPGKTVEANDLILRSNSASAANQETPAQPAKSSQAPVMPVVTGVLALEIDLRPDLAADAILDADASSLWYCISAPFDVDINSGFEWVYPDGHRTAMTHNTDFQIFAYDGARRATGISGWKRTSGTMKAGVAHFIGFDNANTNQKVIRLTAKTNTVSAATTIPLSLYEGSAENMNWNGIANPTLQYIGIDKDIVAFDYLAQDYNTYASGDYNYAVGSPFFIQAEDEDPIVINNDTHGAVHAPKRADDRLEYCVRIQKSTSKGFEGQMYVRASETASNQYEAGHDMASMGSTTPKYSARIWTENYNTRLGIEEAPLTNGNASYVLGIATPAAGEYTISVAAPKENATLYLTYNGSIIWNLSNGAYTIDLPKGITSGYGLVMQAKAPQVGTGIESQAAIVNGVEKVVINNTIYILRDQQMYDLTGKMVK